MDNDLSKLIAELGEYQKTTIETSYDLLTHPGQVEFPPECIVTIIYERGEIAFSAFCVPLDVLATLADPTTMPNYIEQKDYPYCSFTIDETVFRICSVSVK